MEKKETERQRIGRIGEDVAARYLRGRGFSVLERNYRKKWGELDIVAERGGAIRFVEVKTVTRDNVRGAVSGSGEEYLPEENVHPWKLKRLHRAIQTYLEDRSREEDEWQLDLVMVFLDEKRGEAKVELLENIG